MIEVRLAKEKELERVNELRMQVYDLDEAAQMIKERYDL